MKSAGNRSSNPSRRAFLAAAGGLVAAAGATSAASGSAINKIESLASAGLGSEPFWGTHQSGIVTPVQSYTYFAVFDLLSPHRNDVVKTLQAWTSAAAELPTGGGSKAADNDPAAVAPDSGETLGLPPGRLTITFGFGAGLFVKDGKDRYSLAARRPAALVDLPRFHGDQLDDSRTGGDLSVQACANDPQVAFHAIRHLARLAGGVAQVRWAQTGFLPSTPSNQTPRNLMGFKDGTINPSPSDTPTLEKFVWVGNEGPEWMRGGSYLVARRIRMALEHWDRVTVAFQEQTIGRHKLSGAPLTGSGEFDALDLSATDKDGNSLIADNAHVRLAAAESNDGTQILRRPYSYNDGVNFTSERWPPWHQGIEYDAGLFFLAYQRDPRTGFIRMFDKMANLDMLNQFVTHTGGGLFACPGGIARGEYLGQRLFSSI